MKLDPAPLCSRWGRGLTLGGSGSLPSQFIVSSLRWGLGVGFVLQHCTRNMLGEHEARHKQEVVWWFSVLSYSPPINEPATISKWNER